MQPSKEIEAEEQKRLLSRQWFNLLRHEGEYVEYVIPQSTIQQVQKQLLSLEDKNVPEFEDGKAYDQMAVFGRLTNRKVTQENEKKVMCLTIEQVLIPTQKYHIWLSFTHPLARELHEMELCDSSQGKVLYYSDLLIVLTHLSVNQDYQKRGFVLTKHSTKQSMTKKKFKDHYDWIRPAKSVNFDPFPLPPQTEYTLTGYGATFKRNDAKMGKILSKRRWSMLYGILIQIEESVCMDIKCKRLLLTLIQSSVNMDALFFRESLGRVQVVIKFVAERQKQVRKSLLQGHLYVFTQLLLCYDKNLRMIYAPISHCTDKNRMVRLSKFPVGYSLDPYFRNMKKSSLTIYRLPQIDRNFRKFEVDKYDIEFISGRMMCQQITLDCRYNQKQGTKCGCGKEGVRVELLGRVFGGDDADSVYLHLQHYSLICFLGLQKMKWKGQTFLEMLEEDIKEKGAGTVISYRKGNWYERSQKMKIITVNLQGKFIGKKVGGYAEANSQFAYNQQFKTSMGLQKYEDGQITPNGVITSHMHPLGHVITRPRPYLKVVYVHRGRFQSSEDGTDSE